MESSPTTPPSHDLIRAIGRCSLVALVVNSIIGSGVFGLPSTVAALIGNYSPYAVLAAGAGMSVIMGCFAEVASRFQEAGGPYLYARVAFGRFMGIQTAWMLWLAFGTEGKTEKSSPVKCSVASVNRPAQLSARLSVRLIPSLVE